MLFIRRLTAFYHQRPAEIVAAFLTVVVVIFIQISHERQVSDWPQQWSFHHRILFDRFEHAVPQFTYQVNGTSALVPYLGTAAKALQSGDSISKQIAADRLYIIHDSADYQIVTQWAWNKTTRDFEVAGCFRSKH